LRIHRGTESQGLYLYMKRIARTLGWDPGVGMKMDKKKLQIQLMLSLSTVLAQYFMS